MQAAEAQYGSAVTCERGDGSRTPMSAFPVTFASTQIDVWLKVCKAAFLHVANRRARREFTRPERQP